MRSGAAGGRWDGLSAKIAAIYAVLTLASAAAWCWALLVFHRQPVLLGTALLAYGFGLRHAVDADHIAAIDNATRKLMQEGKRPVGIGLWFALGHSAVVVIAAAVIAATASTMRDGFAILQGAGGVISASACIVFLFAIAAMNLLILRSVWRALRRLRAGGSGSLQDPNGSPYEHGLLARLFRPLFRLITESWHLFPLGFLFGLGFDTVTEIGLLGISGTEAAKGVSVWSIMVFPALFASGMSLVDTSDGILMLGAYAWALVKPARRLYYNLAITSVSVLVAVVIGGLKALRLIGGELGRSGWFWDAVAAINGNFNNLGLVIIGLFIAAWVGSMLVYRYAGIWSRKAESARN